MIKGRKKMNNDLIFNIGKRVIILVLLISGIFALVFPEPKAIILGLIFGSIISILSLKLIDNTISKAVKMPPGRARGHSITHYFARYIIYFFVLLVAAKAEYLNLLSTIGGLLTVKFVIIFSTIFDKNFHR